MNQLKTQQFIGEQNGLPVRKFSSAASIAARLDVNKATIFRWADAGRITRFKVNGRVVRFDEAEILALIEGGRVSLEQGGVA